VIIFAETNDDEQKFEGLSCKRSILIAVEQAITAPSKLQKQRGESMPFTAVVSV
jgi:hypothetical protein